MTNERKHITQPADWWSAYQAAAERAGVSLSEWIGLTLNSQLPKKVTAKLSERPPAHRPRSKENG